MTPRALMLSPELPYPLQGGGALRTASLLNYLAQHHTVDLILFRHLDSQAPRESLPPGLADRILVLELPRHKRDTVSRALRNTRRLLQGTPPLVDRFRGFEEQIAEFLTGHRYATAVIEHFWCAPYHDVIAPHADRVVINLHNIESELHRSEAKAAESVPQSFAHARFASMYSSLENHWLPRFAQVLTASDPDAARVRSLNPQVSVYPNSIPCQAVPDVQEEEVIAFSGNFDYHPNQTAVAWFAHHIWPGLAAANPNLRWRLIGMNPESVQSYLTGLPRVECTGPVVDAVAELARACVVVVPLQSGSGTRLKIVEAWAARRPVISTSIGAEGLPHGPLWIADTHAAFRDAISNLLSDHLVNDRLAILGRQCFEQNYTWEAAWRSLTICR